MRPIFKEEYIQGLHVGPATHQDRMNYETNYLWIRQRPDGKGFEGGTISHDDLIDIDLDADQVPQERKKNGMIRPEDTSVRLSPDFRADTLEEAKTKSLRYVNTSYQREDTVVAAIDDKWSNSQDPGEGDTTTLRRAVLMRGSFYYSGFMVSSDRDMGPTMGAHPFKTLDEARADAETLTLSLSSGNERAPKNAVRFDRKDPDVIAAFAKSDGLITTYARTHKMDMLEAAQHLAISGAIAPNDDRLDAIGMVSVEKKPLPASIILDNAARQLPKRHEGWDTTQETVRLTAIKLEITEGGMKPAKAAEQLERWALAESSTKPRDDGSVGLPKVGFMLMQAAAASAREDRALAKETPSPKRASATDARE